MSPSETTPLLAAPVSTPARTTSPPRPEEDAVRIEVEHPLGSSPAALLPPLPLNQLVTPRKRAAILAAVWTG
jgi:crotonobetainyl-CoA:carnitine CoA-transferase CaiB-like acyl-CoA transferase